MRVTGPPKCYIIVVVVVVVVVLLGNGSVGGGRSVVDLAIHLSADDVVLSLSRALFYVGVGVRK